MAAVAKGNIINAFPMLGQIVTTAEKYLSAAEVQEILKVADQNARDKKFLEIMGKKVTFKDRDSQDPIIQFVFAAYFP